MMMKKIVFALSIFCALCIAFINVHAQQTTEPMTAKLDVPAPDGIRPGGTLNQELPAPKIPRDRISTGPASRNYPEQPPMIPHNIRGYQIDKNFNMCLTCHSRNASPQTGATMVSITHYYDRDGQALAAVSPRRYFCVQCHLPQADVEPARTNNYQSIDALLQSGSGE
ncbi:nitrate reductase cytochrome c-type subunit [Cellvibrio sp. UBA7661]|uniref:nitrate reductase cytochrome c-type subunit n=1 Tax=Cellvibrio sp. UBA7661 TaxID=1946311 RepID=UPI002F354B73